MLVLGRSQVEALIDLDALIDALAPAMADLSSGSASAPARIAALVPEQEGFLAAMPGYVPSADVLMAKLVSLFPRNAGTPLPTHQAAILVFDSATGAPAALLDGTAITTARTAACSALSARLLAREDAPLLAVLGTGVQARSHIHAMCRVRPIRGVRIAAESRRKPLSSPQSCQPSWTSKCGRCPPMLRRSTVPTSPRRPLTPSNPWSAVPG